jgi:hypothetical protein
MRTLFVDCQKRPAGALRRPKVAGGAFGPLVKGVTFARSTRCAKGVTFAQLIIVAMAFYAGTAAYADSFERQVPAEPTGRVEISNVSGSVEVIGWDRPQVDVRGELDGDVQRVDVTSRKGLTSIKVVLPSQSSHGGEAALKVRVPKGSEIEVVVVSADVRSTGVLGVQRLKTVSGDIVAELAQAETEVKTVSGDTILRGIDKITRVRASSVSGNISYERGAGDLEATLVSGDLRVDLKPARAVRVRTTSGDVTLRGRLDTAAGIEMEAISGQLFIETSSNTGVRYEASTFSGDIVNCFGAHVERTSQYGPGKRLSGVHGDGKAELRLKTLSGDIDICDR